MNQNKIEEIIAYQERVLEFLKRELEKTIEEERAEEANSVITLAEDNYDKELENKLDE